MRFLLVIVATVLFSSLSQAYSLQCHGQMDDLQIQIQSQGEAAVESFGFEVQGTGFDPIHDSGTLQTQSKLMQGNILVLAGLGQLQVDQFDFEIQLNPLRPQNSLMIISFEDGQRIEFPIQCRSQQFEIEEPKLISAVRRAFPISLPVEKDTAFRF